MRRWIAFILTVLTVLSLVFVCFSSCGKSEKQYSVSTLDLFDTVTIFYGYAESREEFLGVWGDVYARLSGLHRLYDIYEGHGGGIYEINASREPVAVSADVIGLLKYAKEVYEKSGGVVNTAMGSVLSLWHECRESEGERVLPSGEALADAALHCGIDGVIIDEEAGTVYLSDPDASLDLGALAKGYAARLIAEEFVLDGYMLNFGGMVCAFGEKPGAKDGLWVAGLEDPLGGDEPIGYVSLKGKYLVTSGAYLRYFEVDGKRYCHIIDPETLYPAELYAAVTILADDPADGDALSTVLFCMSEEDGRELLAGYGAEALWVYPDGRISATAGFALK